MPPYLRCHQSSPLARDSFQGALLPTCNLKLAAATNVLPDPAGPA